MLQQSVRRILPQARRRRVRLCLSSWRHCRLPAVHRQHPVPAHLAYPLVCPVALLARCRVLHQAHRRRGVRLAVQLALLAGCRVLHQAHRRRGVRLAVQLVRLHRHRPHSRVRVPRNNQRQDPVPAHPAHPLVYPVVLLVWYRPGLPPGGPRLDPQANHQACHLPDQALAKAKAKARRQSSTTISEAICQKRQRQNFGPRVITTKAGPSTNSHLLSLEMFLALMIMKMLSLPALKDRLLYLNIPTLVCRMIGSRGVAVGSVQRIQGCSTRR
jgi:hypothetical protein